MSFAIKEVSASTQSAPTPLFAIHPLNSFLTSYYEYFHKLIFNSDIIDHRHTSNSADQRIDFDGLFSGDMGELSNMDTTSQVNPTEDDDIDQSQWQQQDDLNLDENNTTSGLSEETRTKLEECQNELDRLNNEKANLDSQLAQMNNQALRVYIS